MAKKDEPIAPLCKAWPEFMASFQAYKSAVQLLQAEIESALLAEAINQRLAPRIQERLEALKKANAGI